MEITLGNIYSKVLASDIEPLRKHLSVFIEGAYFSKLYKEGKWDGRSYFITKNGVFLTGLFSVIIQYCKDNNIEYTVIDNRNIPNINIPDIKDISIENSDIEKRDYQIKSIYLGLKRKRGIFHLATNAGKTEVACGIIKYINLKTLFLVHTIELLYQSKSRIEKRLSTICGVIGDAEYDIQKITIGTVQTIAGKLNAPKQELKRWEEKKEILLNEDKPIDRYEKSHKAKMKKFNEEKKKIKEYLKTVKIIFIDECHHQQSATWMTILKYTPAPFRYGLSATPYDHNNANDWKLMGMTGKVINKITNQDLIKLGHSAEPFIYIYKYQTEIVPKSINYSDVYQRVIVDSKPRNELIKHTAQVVKGTTLIIVRLIKHGNMLNNLIPGSVFVNGTESTEFRKNVMHDIKRGEIKTLIATPIYDEGIDVPSIYNLIIACGGKSDRKTIQRVGRVLRKKEDGENKVLVFDFYDHTKYLKDHSKERILTYKREGFLVKVIRSSKEIYE